MFPNVAVKQAVGLLAVASALSGPLIQDMLGGGGGEEGGGGGGRRIIGGNATCPLVATLA